MSQIIYIHFKNGIIMFMLLAQNVQQILNTLGYTKSNEVPELCGWNPVGRNRIWWPDNETETAAMAIVKKELNRPGLTPWFNIALP